MATKQRIIQYLELNSMSRPAFLKRAGLKRGFLESNKLDQTVNEKQFAAIMQGFPELNIEWLITGQGPMIKQQPADTSTIPPNLVSLDRYAELVRENERLRIQLQQYQSQSTHQPH